MEESDRVGVKSGVRVPAHERVLSFDDYLIAERGGDEGWRDGSRLNERGEVGDDDDVVERENAGANWRYGGVLGTAFQGQSRMACCRGGGGRLAGGLAAERACRCAEYRVQSARVPINSYSTRSTERDPQRLLTQRKRDVQGPGGLVYLVGKAQPLASAGCKYLEYLSTNTSLARKSITRSFRPDESPSRPLLPQECRDTCINIPIRRGQRSDRICFVMNFYTHRESETRCFASQWVNRQVDITGRRSDLPGNQNNRLPTPK